MKRRDWEPRDLERRDIFQESVRARAAQSARVPTASANQESEAGWPWRSVGSRARLRHGVASCSAGLATQASLSVSDDVTTPTNAWYATGGEEATWCTHTDTHHLLKSFNKPAWRSSSSVKCYQHEASNVIKIKIIDSFLLSYQWNLGNAFRVYRKLLKHLNFEIDYCLDDEKRP